MKTFTQTLADELRRAAAQTPDRVFLRMIQGEWTFARVDVDSDHMAVALHDLGVAHRHNVSLLLPNCIEFALSWFGLAKLGAVAAPVNTAFRGTVLANAINLVQSERFGVSRYWDEMRILRATVFDFMGATLTMLWKQPASAADRQGGEISPAASGKRRRLGPRSGK